MLPLLVACALGAASLAGQRRQDSPEPVIRSLVLAIYSNDVASYNTLTVPHPLRSRLTAGGSVNAVALRELKADPGGLQIREMRPPLFKGKPAAPGPTGQFPVGSTDLYVVAHRGGPMVMVLVRQADGWRVDLRWWIAMTDLASGRTAAPDSPEVAIRGLLAAMLRLDRPRAARYLTDAKLVDYLFLDAPSSREPSGVLDATVEEMPLVVIDPGEFFPLPNDRVIEGVRDPDRQVLVGLFGPVEMPFVVRRSGSVWRVDAEPYFDLMMR